MNTNKSLILVLLTALLLSSCENLPSIKISIEDSRTEEKTSVPTLSEEAKPESEVSTVPEQPQSAAEVLQNSPNDNEPKAITQSASGITPQQLNRRAKYFTVRIDGVQNGSGVIVEQSDNTYTVLTNWHVVQEAGQYTIQTSDGRQHQVNYQQVKQLPEVDLALVKFTSEQNYQIAKVGDSDYLSEGQGVHLAGYPGVKTNNDRLYRFYNLNIVSLLDTPINQGYSVLYEGETISGMSGSPLLDGEGNLVGIHGLYRVDDPTIRKGSSYAIPINTYKELMAKEPESTEEVASQPNHVTTSKPSPILIKKSTKSAESQKTVTQKQADNIVAHQEGQASEAIRTHMGPHQMPLKLMSMKITGQILTMVFHYHVPIGKEDELFQTRIPLDDVSYIEDDTGKQVGVLQNEQKKYLASPLSTLDSLHIAVGSHSPDFAVVWIKFPVPSPETETISINIPNVAPFDGVPVQR